ncbi:hypothetical protein EXS72_01515 [Candidatus Pacearchaeota archaeon]|nr:hypothetical protein [Candidatus Pacearchaeota archaeon]
MAEEKRSLKWLWVVLSIIGLLIFGPISIYALFFLIMGGYGGGMWTLFGLIPIAIVAMIILGLVRLFSKKKDNSDNKKSYKAQNAPRVMKMEYIFYLVGIVFLFISVGYFIYEYVSIFPDSVKLVLLIVAIVVFYILAEFKRVSDK